MSLFCRRKIYLCFYIAIETSCMFHSYPKIQVSLNGFITSLALGCFSGGVTVINLCNSWKREDVSNKECQRYEKQIQSSIDSLDSRNSNFCLEFLFQRLLLAKQSFYFISSRLHGMGGSNSPRFLEHLMLFSILLENNTLLVVWLHLTCLPIPPYFMCYI